MSSPHLTSRRQLLSAAAAAPALFHRPSRWWERATAPNDRITLGVIGCGTRGKNLLNNYFLRDDAFQVMAVCEVDSTRRALRKDVVDKKYGNSDCATYVDYQDLLSRDDIDAVVIATPDHWHANQIIHACKAGKDIYSEKPLTLTLHECKAVIEAVNKHGVVFQTGSQQRTEWGGSFRRACELVRNGKLGDVLTVNVGVGPSPVWCDLETEEMEDGLDWDRWLGPAPMRPYSSVLSPRGMHGHYPAWRKYREYAGGSLADMGAHHFDIAQWGLGMDASGPIKVVPPENNESDFGASLVYANGTRLTHGGRSGTTFIGSNGILHIDRGRIASIPESILEAGLGEGDTPLRSESSNAADWRDCIRDRSLPLCNAEVGARSAAICHLMNIAHWHDRELEWDPEAWRFVGDDEANTWLDYERREGYRLPNA